MEILETMPVYGTPDWSVITLLIGIVISVCALICLRDTEYAGPVVGALGLVIMTIGLFATALLHNSEFKRNDYVVRLTNMSAQEFIEKYEVVKRFEYSDVIQVKEIEE